MSTNADVTLRRVIYELNQWADDHSMINQFWGFGEFLQVSQEDRRNYPAMVVNVLNAPSETWYFNYNFEIMVLDWMQDDQSNRKRVMSDTRQILNDLEETISYSNRWQDFSKIQGQINCQPTIQKGQDKAFGWIASFTLKVKKRHGICDLQSLMPEYDFETGTITGVRCEPVSIYENDILVDEVASGGEYRYSSGEFVYDLFFDGVDTGENVTVDGTNITINLR